MQQLDRRRGISKRCELREVGLATVMEGSFTVPADRVTVWTRLNDPVVLKRCISGCETLEKLSDTSFVATARVRIGPLSTAFKGRIDLQDVNAPQSCRLLGEGAGGLAGFARGAADVRLTEVPEGTAVSYAVEANLGGKLARLGGRLIDGAAKRVADKFFTAFVADLSTDEVARDLS